jgi:hypothetical protein
MLLKAKSSITTSLDATQCKLMIAIVMATLVALGSVVVNLRVPAALMPGLRAAATPARWRLAPSCRREPTLRGGD